MATKKTQPTPATQHRTISIRIPTSNVAWGRGEVLMAAVFANRKCITHQTPKKEENTFLYVLL